MLTYFSIESRMGEMHIVNIVNIVHIFSYDSLKSDCGLEMRRFGTVVNLPKVIGPVKFTARGSIGSFYI